MLRSRDENFYDICFAEGFTLEGCLQKAKDTFNVIGVEFTVDDGLCSLVYDDVSELNCPNGFDGDSRLDGTGPIFDSDGEAGVECYRCDSS